MLYIGNWQHFHIGNISRYRNGGDLPVVCQR